MSRMIFCKTRFSVFLFKYFQSNQRLKMNDFVQVNFNSDKIKDNKKFNQSCIQNDEKSLKLFHTSYNIRIEVKISANFENFFFGFLN